MTKPEKLRREDLEPIIQRLAVLNRGFDLTTNQVIEYESCLERLPTLGHVDRVITIAIEHQRDHQPANRPPAATSESLEARRRQLEELRKR